MWAVEMYQRSEIQKWISRQYGFPQSRGRVHFGQQLAGAMDIDLRRRSNDLH